MRPGRLLGRAHNIDCNMVSPTSATPPKSSPKSPVRSIKKKNAFSPNNPYKKKSSSTKVNGNHIRITATRGNEEMISILKGDDTAVDNYILNVKDDIENSVEYVIQLMLAGCLPRRESKESHVVALSR
eukprot:scaffold266383_cov92-Attheya_sp.AAC.1